MKIFITGTTGYIGGSVARALALKGHEVRGLVRRDTDAEAVRALGVTPVQGNLDDGELLGVEARRADAIVNAADSDHAGAADALVRALEGSGKTLVHTSGSSIVSDGANGEPTDTIYDEATRPAPVADKAARVAIDRRVLTARGVRGVVLCPPMIYGVGSGLHVESVQVPALVAGARRGRAPYIGRGANVWSNVHIDDVVDLYARVLSSKSDGGFYFIESGEASFRDIAHAIADRLGLEGTESWPIEKAVGVWGDELARHALGSNSRVRAGLARKAFGWQPQHHSLPAWIREELQV